MCDGTSFDFLTKVEYDEDFLDMKGNKWRLVPGKVEEFWINFCHEKDNHLHLSEKTKEYVPLIIDIEVYFKDVEEPYQDDFIRATVKLIQKVALKNYKITEPNKKLICLFLESRSVDKYELGSVKHLIHTRFHFPFLVVDKMTLDNLRLRLIKSLESQQINRYLDTEGKWEDIITVHNGTHIPIYTSSRGPKDRALKYYSTHPNYHNKDNVFDFDAALDLESEFDFENHVLIYGNRASKDKFSGYNKGDDLLAFFLSVNGYRHITFATEQKKKKEVNLAELIADEDEGSQRQTALTLIQLIDQKRFHRYNDWHDIGKALHSSFEGSDKGLQAWINASNVSTVPDFVKSYGGVEKACQDHYLAIDEFNNPVTVRTIAWYAREDNQKLYQKWHHTWITESMEKALSITHSDVAEAFYRCYWLDFICAYIGKRFVWYRFHNNKWNKDEAGVSVRETIARKFRTKFDQMKIELLQRIEGSQDENLRKETDAVVKRVSVIANKLGDNGYKTALIKELNYIFNVGPGQRFFDYLDRNPYLTGHPNGISEVNMKTGTIIFRKGKPEDYVSKSTRAKYNDKLSFSHPDVKRYLTMIRQVFVTDETCRLHLKLEASSFVAGNIDKKIYFYTGDTNNAKSTLGKLRIAIWGSYTGKIPPTLLTKGFGDPSKANSAISRTEGWRTGTTDEIDKNHTINEAVAKIISGNDSIAVREMYQETRDMQQTATIIASLNDPIQAESSPAMRDRMIYIHCGSTFVPLEKAPKNKEDQYRQRLFPVDPNFINRVGKFAEAALWVAAQYFPIYVKEGMKLPTEVKSFIDEYWKENDIYNLFINDMLEETSANNGVKTKAVYEEFKVWYRDNYPGKRIPSVSSAIRSLNDKLGRSRNGIWVGFKFKEADTEDGVVITDPRSSPVKKEKINYAMMADQPWKGLDFSIIKLVKDDEPCSSSTVY